MANYTFANLDKWVLKTRARALAVVKASAQEVIEVAQVPKAKGGRMPVQSSHLRNSLASSLQGRSGTKGATSYVAIAAGMQLGEIADFQWTADYAAAVNNGRNGGAGAHFVEGAVGQWPQIVAAQTAKAKASIT